MQIAFDDPGQRRLYEDPTFNAHGYDALVVRRFRRAVLFVASAGGWRDVESTRSLGVRRVDGLGPHWYSVDLVERWLLRVRLERGAGPERVAIGDVLGSELGVVR